MPIERPLVSSGSQPTDPGRALVTRRELLAGAAVFGVLAGCSGGDDGSANVGGARDGGTDNAPADVSAVTEPAQDTSPISVAEGGVPLPVDMVRTSWSTDPWARGSYSYLPVGATPDHRAQLTIPVDFSLFFAGEALSADSPSTVHGARASGEIVAEQVLAAGAASVIVVGAGASGLRAAALLADLGLAVTVVEGRDRIGGRVDTVRPEGWPIPVERGASWVHDTEASDLVEALDELGVATVPFDYETSTLGPDGVRIDDVAAYTEPALEALEAAQAWAEDLDEDLTFAAALADSGEGEGLDPVALALLERSEVATEYGASLDELSVWWGTEEGSEGDDVLVVGGYGALLEADAEGLDIRLGWQVVEVSYDETGVEVRSESGETLDADAVIVTIPIGVLQGDEVSFDPPLPDTHRAAIDALGMGLLDKVWLRFEQQWWTEPAQMWTIASASPDEVVFTEWFNLAAVTGEPILLGLLGSHTARAWAEASDDDLLAAAMRSLQLLADAGW